MKLKKQLACLMTALLMILQLPVFAEEAADTAVVDPNAFTVVSTTPFDGQTNVSPADLQVDVTFSEAVDPETLVQANVSVSGNAYGAIVATGEKTATIYLNRMNVNVGTKYTVKLRNGIKSMDGKELTEYSFSFSMIKDAPNYRQITNGQFNDPKNIYGLDKEAWNNIAVIDDGGNNVLKFTGGWDEASVRQRVYVKPGKTYTARAKVKTDVSQEVWLAMDWLVPGNAQDYYHSPRGTELKAGEWVDLEYSWTIPENVDQNARIIKQWIAAGKAGNTIYVDEWQFYEAGNDVPPPVIGGADGGSGITKVSEDYDDVAKLRAFGILLENANGTGIVKRTDLAQTLLSLIGLKGVPSAAPAVKFTDVSEDAMPVVSAVYALGFMNGCSETEFEPDSAVTENQALKAVLSVMGWSSVAEEKGGYPYGYRQVAVDLGIMNSAITDPEAALNYTQFAGIVDEALTAELLSAKVYTRIPDEYELTRGGTLLGTYFNYERAAGVIEGTGRTDLNSSDGLKTDQVSIGGVVYNCDADLNKYLGYEVDVYYEKTKNGGVCQAIYVTGMNELNRVVEFAAYDDYISYDKNAYSVLRADEKNEKIYRLNKDKKVIYNGKYLKNYREEAENFVPDYGAVKLIDSGNGFSTVVITDIRTVIVSSIDFDEKVIYDYLDDSKPIVLTDCEEMIIKDNEESTYAFNDLKQWVTLSVIASQDNEYAEMYLSEETTSGALSSVKEDGSAYEIVIADNYYGPNVRETQKTVNGLFAKDELQLGNNGTYYIDYRGRVAALLTNAISSGVGFLIDARCDANRLSSSLELRVYDKSDQMLELTGADSMRIDNVSVKKPAEALNMLKNGTEEVCSQLILYKTNADGKVTSIDTAYNKRPNTLDYRVEAPTSAETRDSFHLTYSSLMKPDGKISFSADGKSFSGKVLLEEQPVMFFVPSNTKTGDEEIYRISRDYWDMDGDNATIEAYQSDTSSMVTDYLVVYLEEGKYNPDHIGEGRKAIVNSVSNVLLEDESVTQVELLDGNKIYTEDLSNLNGAGVGDYIEYKIDKNKKMIQPITVIFDASEKQALETNPNPKNFDDYRRGILANVYEKKGSVLKVTIPEVDMTSSTVSDYEMMDIGSANLFIYESDKDAIRSTSSSEIFGYKTAADKHSTVIVLSSDARVNTVLILD